MSKLNKNIGIGAVIWGTLTAAAAFGAISYGVSSVLAARVTTQNYAAYAILALLLGGVAAGLWALKLPAALYVYEAGLVAGFAYMYYVFSRDMGGWGDLAGLLSFFVFATTGLGAGIVIQIAVYLYKKNRTREE